MAGAVMLGGIVYYAVCVFPTNEVHSNPAPGRIDVDQKAVAARASAGDPQAQLQMGILGLEITRAALSTGGRAESKFLSLQ